jgi:methylenetetrahydrofolate dehydrogenase (NADP+)/methenyltetrahydrofolate cyclohydrolase
MAEILYGKDVAAAMENGLRQEILALKAEGIEPALATVRIGDREDDIAYERGVIKKCGSLGIGRKMVGLSPNSSEGKLISVLQRLNRDDAVHGVLLFRPLPGHMDDGRVRGVLAPEKDVDGITDLSLSGVFAGTGDGYAPCTAQACIELLDHYGVELAGKKAVVIGRSLVIGKPVAMMLLARNATVTVCHSKTKDLAETCRAADILIVAAGRAGLVDAGFINPCGVVIDVGINLDEDGNLCGDVRREDAERAKSYSPVPGGVGSVTTSVLAAHVLAAARKSQKG